MADLEFQCCKESSWASSLGLKSVINIQSKAILSLPVRVSFSDSMAYQGTVILLFLKFVLKNFWLHPTACGILVPGPGTKPKPFVLEGGILTTDPPGKPQGS